MKDLGIFLKIYLMLSFDWNMTDLSPIFIEYRQLVSAVLLYKPCINWTIQWSTCAFHSGQGGEPTGMAPRLTRVLGSIPVGQPPDQYVLSVSGAPLNLRQWDDDMETKDVIDRLLDKWTGCTALPRLLGDLIQPGCRVTAVFLIERRSTK